MERDDLDCGAPETVAAAGAESTAGPTIPDRDIAITPDKMAPGEGIVLGQISVPPLPELSPVPLEMRVKHKVIVRHMLIGNCPRCGAELATERRDMIEAFESGRTESSACQCGQLLSIPGKSMIVRANMGPNRHQRRAMGK